MGIRVPEGDRERALASLLELAREGYDEVAYGGEVEFGVYTDRAGEDRLRAAFDTVESTPVSSGWENGWRAFHRPVEVAGLWVGPPWETPPADRLGVVIDPGRAFGTGAHPTTQLCIELLAGADRGSLVDVGCGSGVLTIAAARLGFGPLVAIDDDPVAIEVTRANAAVNGVNLEARVVDALREPIPVADVAVANVLLVPVERILARLAARTAVTSGYLEGEVPAHSGWSRTTTKTRDGWAADRFVRV